MKPKTIIYWTRVLMGVVVALLCAFLNAVGNISLLNAITIALLFYIITHYIYRARFLTKVEKASKILTTGIGAYFLTWIVIFVLFSTLMGPALTITNPAPNAVFSANDTVTIVAKITNQFGNPFSGANVTTQSPNGTLITFNETSPGIYSATYNVASADPSGTWNMIVAASIRGKYRETYITVNIQTGS